VFRKSAIQEEQNKKTAEEERTFGIAKRRMLRKVQVVSFIVMALVSFIFIENVNLIQGNAKVINYIGLIRGDTQRLVKEELYGVRDDELISQMDELLYSLQTGKGEYQDIKLSDPQYQKALSAQIESWKKLKKEIYSYRSDQSERQQLFQMSQDYFQTADYTAQLAQNFSGAIEDRVRVIEWLMIALIIADGFVIILYGIELGKATRHNMKLSSLAYIDPGTGLSSKRKCEERLSDPAPVPARVRVTCFMFDINNLKKVNDGLGHEAGDALIAGFGEALRQEASPHMFTGRFGGDEFIAIAVHMSQADAVSFVKRLQDNCKHRKSVGDAGISFAAGYAVSTEFTGLNISELMNIADRRMYENKEKIKQMEQAQR
jgi:diguanylate cyclase (GGDEF)-like protein